MNIEQIINEVDALNKARQTISYINYAVNQYINNIELSKNKIADSKSFAKIIQELINKDLQDILLNIDYGQYKFIRQNCESLQFRNELLLAPEPSSYFIHSLAPTWADKLSNNYVLNEVYQIYFHFNYDHFYITDTCSMEDVLNPHQNKIPYSYDTLKQLVEKQLTTYDKIFITDLHIINIFNLFYDGSVTDEQWLRFLNKDQDLGHFAASAINYLTTNKNARDLDSIKFMHTISQIDFGSFSDVDINDLNFINIQNKHLLSEIFYYFINTRFELGGFNDCYYQRDEDIITIELNDSTVLHPLKYIFKVRIAEDNSLSFMFKNKEINMPFSMTAGTDKPFSQIVEFVNLAFNQVLIAYSHNDKKYIKDYQKTVIKHIKSEIPKNITGAVPLSVDVIKKELWCNPPLLNIKLGDYVYECGYEDFEFDFENKKDDILISCEKYILNHRTNGNFNIQKNNRL